METGSMTRGDPLEVPYSEISDRLRKAEEDSAALSSQLRALQERLGAIEAGAGNAVAYGRANYDLHRTQTAIAERSLLLQGRIAAQGVPERLRTLADAEFCVFSQWGEDGIVDWLVRHVPVPNTRFIEFGVENFREANCRFLLQNRNWRGLVIDGNQKQIQQLRNDSIFWMYDLVALAAFITAENINDLFRGAGFEGPLGILSVDIDGNDYWVLDRIDCVDPAILICEYNSLLGDTRPVVVPYKADTHRFEGHYSGLYYGVSISALTLLAKRKGYTLVGTNSYGSNAFFVRDDLAHHVLDRIETVDVHPTRCRDSRNEQGQLTFAAGLDRYTLIKDLPVVDVETNETMLLSEIKPLYSEAWISGMT
jgi:hypothetical protein